MRKRLLIAVAVAAPLPATAQVSPARDNIDALIEAHAKAAGVPASFIHRVVKRESGYNPRAVGRGGALGLMQIKHGTARALGYSGPASGLLDAKINLTYGVAYLAGAYKTAHGNEAQAYSYYARGYYYAAKRAGVRTDVAELEAPPVRELPTNPLNKFLGSVFGSRQAATTAAATTTASADPSVAALSSAVAQPGAAPQYTLPPPAAPQALAAYQPAAAQVQAPEAAAQASAQAAADPVVTVPLPPVRPASLAFHAAPHAAPGAVLAYADSAAGAGLPFPTSGQTVSLAAAPAAASAPSAPPAAPSPAATTVASLDPAAAVPEPAAGPKVPLPPRRPVEFRHFVLRKAAPPVPQTAAATPEPAAAIGQ